METPAPPAKRKRAALVLAPGAAPAPPAPFPHAFRELKAAALATELLPQVRAVPRVAWAIVVPPPELSAPGAAHHQRAVLEPVRGVALHWQDRQGQPVTYFVHLEPADLPAAAALLKEARKKVAYDTQRQLREVLRRGAEVGGDLEDPKVAAWLLNPALADGHKALTLAALMAAWVEPAYAPPPCLTLMHAAVAHAVESFQLFAALAVRVAAVEAYHKVEMPIVRVLAEMEVAGVGFRRDECAAALAYVVAKSKEVEEAAEACVGRVVNLNSGDQVAELLFGHLRLPQDGVKRTGSGKRLSVDEDTIDLLLTRPNCHPVVPLIRQHRKLEKLSRSFIMPLLAHAVDLPDGLHRLHCSVLQCAVPTGRLATKDPNLQCLPHEMDVSSAQVPVARVAIRAAIVPAPGCVLVSADYSALELRLIGHFSKDKKLLALLRTPGVDLFRSIARSIYDLEEGAPVDAAQRESAKRIVYGVLYGMGLTALAVTLGCTTVEAERWQRSFFGAFPGVKEWMRDAVADCAAKGYVVTLSGRRRHFPEISKPGAAGAAAARQAVNTICQGSAADLVKLAMIDLAAQLARRRCEQGAGARLLMQIHDELLLEVPEAELAAVVPLVRRAMEGAVKADHLLVPMVVKVSAGGSWDSLQELPPT